MTITGTFFQDGALILSALAAGAADRGLARPPRSSGCGRVGVLARASPGCSARGSRSSPSRASGPPRSSIKENDDLPQELGADDSSTALFFVAVLVCVAAPIAEELFFRGFCFTALRRWIGVAGGAIADRRDLRRSSTPARPTRSSSCRSACSGSLLCLLYHRTGSLLPCMVLHALNNSLALGVSQSWEPLEVIALMVGASVAVLAIVAAVRAPGRASDRLSASRRRAAPARRASRPRRARRASGRRRCPRAGSARPPRARLGRRARAAPRRARPIASAASSRSGRIAPSQRSVASSPSRPARNELSTISAPGHGRSARPSSSGEREPVHERRQAGDRAQPRLRVHRPQLDRARAAGAGGCPTTGTCSRARRRPRATPRRRPRSPPSRRTRAGSRRAGRRGTAARGRWRSRSPAPCQYGECAARPCSTGR